MQQERLDGPFPSLSDNFEVLLKRCLIEKLKSKKSILQKLHIFILCFLKLIKFNPKIIVQIKKNNHLSEQYIEINTRNEFHYFKRTDVLKPSFLSLNKIRQM